METNITQLPPETLPFITKHLRLPDVLELSYSCKHFYNSSSLRDWMIAGGIVQLRSYSYTRRPFPEKYHDAVRAVRILGELGGVGLDHYLILRNVRVIYLKADIGVPFSLSALPSFQALHTLVYPNDRIDRDDLEALADCRALRTLRMMHTTIRNLRPIGSCQALTTLKIADCDLLDSVDGLASCQALRNLTMNGCIRVTNIQSLPSSLHYLDMRDCRQVAQIDRLSVCQKLTNLTMARCKSVVTIAPLSRCRTLRVLDIKGCDRLTSIGYLPSSLLDLNMNFCLRITNIHSLAGCHNLLKLRMRQCEGITSIDMLPTSLQLLDLSKCANITSCDVLVRCHALVRLDMSDTPESLRVEALPPFLQNLLSCTA